MLLLSDVMDILLMAGTLRKKEARSIQLPPSSKKSLNFTHVGLKNTKLILIILFLWD